MTNEADYKQRIRELMDEVKRLSDAAETSHDAYQNLEGRYFALQAELERERAEHRRRIDDLTRQLTENQPVDEQLIAALEPFANAGRHVPEDASPKVFYVPGVINAKTFDLEDLKRAAESLYPDDNENRGFSHR